MSALFVGEAAWPPFQPANIYQTSLLQEVSEVSCLFVVFAFRAPVLRQECFVEITPNDDVILFELGSEFKQCVVDVPDSNCCVLHFFCAWYRRYVVHPVRATH